MYIFMYIYIYMYVYIYIYTHTYPRACTDFLIDPTSSMRGKPLKSIWH